MKKILFLLILLCIEKSLHAQTPYVYTITADSVKITNDCDTAELIIENHTQSIPGFLFNKGHGRTEFRRPQRLDDTTLILGGDTMVMRGKNFANANLTLTGNRTHNGTFHSLYMPDYSKIRLKANGVGPNRLTEMTLDSTEGLHVTSNDGSFILPSNFTVGKYLEYESYDNSNSNDLPMYGLLYFSPSSFYFSIEDPLNSKHAGFSATPGILDIGSDEIDLTSADLANGSSEFSVHLDKFNGIGLYSGSPTIGFKTNFTITHDRFVFKNDNAVNDFRLVGLPESAASADSILVIDDSGQVKKRVGTIARKSATVTGSSYTVPSDIDVVFVNYTGGQATITLPTGTPDREITIKNLHTANTVILSGLDTNESNSIATHGAITVKYTGSSWAGIGKY